MESKILPTDKKKVRTTFEAWYALQVRAIDKMSIVQVREKREDLKKLLESLHFLMREEGIKDSRRKFLKGRRKFVTALLAYTKKRITLFNIVAHNGVSQNLAVRFVQIAAEEIPQREFQKIYALAVMDLEEKESTIACIRDFVNEYKAFFTGEKFNAKNTGGHSGGNDSENSQRRGYVKT